MVHTRDKPHRRESAAEICRITSFIVVSQIMKVAVPGNFVTLLLYTATIPRASLNLVAADTAALQTLTRGKIAQVLETNPRNATVVVRGAEAYMRKLTSAAEWGGGKGHPEKHYWSLDAGKKMDITIETNFRLNKISTRPDLEAQSLFFKETGDYVLDEAINVQGKQRVMNLLTQQDGFEDVIIYRGKPGVAIGRGINEGDTLVGNRENARIVIVRDSSNPRGFYVKTAYPIK